MSASRKTLSPLLSLIAGAALVPVLALPVAPTAQAVPVCGQNSSVTVCETNGSKSIKARPDTTAPSARFPWLGGQPSRGWR